MGKLRSLFVSSIMLLLLANLGLTPAHAADPMQQCTGKFAGNVTSGPDAGASLAGTITLRVDSSGEIDGVFVQGDGSQVQVEGKFKSPIIKLTFDLPDDARITGIGKLPNGFTPCTSNFGGAFRGPRHGDRGDWGIIWGS